MSNHEQSLSLDRMSHLAIFRDLSEAELAIVGAMIHQKSYPAGVDVLEMGERVCAVYFLLRGSVKVYLHRPDRSQVILSVLGTGETLGEMSALDGLPHSASVQTLEQSEFCWMQDVALRECCRTMPTINRNLLQIQFFRQRRSAAQKEALCILDAAGSVAFHLLHLAQQYGVLEAPGRLVIPIRITQKEIAALAGISRERANHVLKGFANRKTISIEAGHFVLHDLQALAKCCAPIAPQLN